MSFKEFLKMFLKPVFYLNHLSSYRFRDENIFVTTLNLWKIADTNGSG